MIDDTGPLPLALSIHSYVGRVMVTSLSPQDKLADGRLTCTSRDQMLGALQTVTRPTNELVINEQIQIYCRYILTSDDVLMAEPISILFYSLVGTQALLIPSNLVGSQATWYHSLSNHHSVAGHWPHFSAPLRLILGCSSSSGQRLVCRLTSSFSSSRNVPTR